MMFSFGSKTCAGKLKHMYMQIKCIGGTENKGFRNPDTYDWLNVSATQPCPDMCPRSHWFLQHLSGQPALGFPEIWRNLSGSGPRFSCYCRGSSAHVKASTCCATYTMCVILISIGWILTPNGDASHF